ncbi:hypothetical protein HRI_005295000 [Hibiscus trionum]|uniref:Uncharacterized protein n=1 Tax=Hibiscus trionum TaxID=183268 RepID=A0A9W7JMB5_HIBTR|nr:hypothetical protein HRI_005295000 [Hibiscus trionum]
MGHVESRVNQQGPPCKAKYSWVTDSEAVAWLREPTGAVAKASLHRAIVTAYGPEPGGEMPLEPRASWFSPKCVEAQLSLKYRGLPLVSTRLRHSGCLPLLDKFNRRISNWKRRLLSYAGRMELISSVLVSLHIYWSSAFRLPEKILKSISLSIRDFFWSDPEPT